VTEIVDRTVKAGGPAAREPQRLGHPPLINQFGTERRMCMAFGVERLDDVAAKLEDVLEMQPPQGLVDKVRGLKKLKSIADSLPQTKRSGPAQEIVVTGDDVDLDQLPIQTCWPGDAAPFITLSAVITRDPRTGTPNDGTYRTYVRDHAPTAALADPQGRALITRDRRRIEVAVALGLDPVTTYSASRRCPAHRRVHARGLLRGEPVQLLKGKTSTRRAGERRGSCSRGTSTRTTTPRSVRRPHRLLHPGRAVPGFHVTAVTMRENAIYPSIASESRRSRTPGSARRPSGSSCRP
jgi:4-hydroxy-3-polyprenylbenzoate decarboxylase